MNMAIDIYPKNIVDSFYNMTVDFLRGRMLVMIYMFTNILCTVKLLFCVIKFVVFNYTQLDGMSL